ncbi:hypothetical protein [Leuconostoc lactis]|uniref:hypothetical protein n=1 Tax=Leuconostoc lactis TaxID=1246 RepID=UPI0012EA4E7B|nr:hypothetical protein [Leuconostoc lactis]
MLRLFLSGVINNIGTTLFNIVFIVYASHKPNPKLAITAVGIISTAPYLLSFLFGYFADQIKNKYLGLVSVRLWQILLYVILSCFINIEKNWLVFGLVLLVNVSSDMLGSFSSYMQLPILKNNTSPEDLAKVRGAQSGIGQTLDLIGAPIGAAILALVHFNFAVFSLINAFSFFLSLVVLYGIKHNVVTVQSNGTSASLEQFSQKFIREILNNFKYIIRVEQLKHFVLIFIVFNLVGAIQTTLISITLLDHSAMLISNFGFTIALIETIEIIGMVAGSFMPLQTLYNMNIEYNLLFEMAMFLLVGVEMLVLPNIYVILGTIFLNGYFAGISNPKIDTFIIQNLPEEKIGGGMGAFYTVVTLGLPIGTAIAGVIAMSVSTTFGWQLLAIMTCFGVVYLIFLAGKYHSKLA